MHEGLRIRDKWAISNLIDESSSGGRGAALVPEVIAGQAFTESVALQQRLTDRLDFLNLHLPCRTLGGQPPLVAYPEARHSGRPYRLEWEEDLLEMQRVYDYLAKGRWFRQVSSQGQFSLGARRYGIGSAFADQTVEITFASLVRELVRLSEDGERETRLPVHPIGGGSDSCLLTSDRFVPGEEKLPAPGNKPPAHKLWPCLQNAG
jgi:hypothetical protein